MLYIVLSLSVCWCFTRLTISMLLYRITALYYVCYKLLLSTHKCCFSYRFCRAARVHEIHNDYSFKFYNDFVDDVENGNDGFANEAEVEVVGLTGILQIEPYLCVITLIAYSHRIVLICYYTLIAEEKQIIVQIFLCVTQFCKFSLSIVNTTYLTFLVPYFS